MPDYYSCGCVEKSHYGVIYQQGYKDNISRVEEAEKRHSTYPYCDQAESNGNDCSCCLYIWAKPFAVHNDKCNDQTRKGDTYKVSPLRIIGYYNDDNMPFHLSSTNRLRPGSLSGKVEPCRLLFRCS